MIIFDDSQHKIIKRGDLKCDKNKNKLMKLELTLQSIYLSFISKFNNIYFIFC